MKAVVRLAVLTAFLHAAVRVLASDDPSAAKGNLAYRPLLLSQSRLSRQSMFWTWDDGRQPVRTRVNTDELSFPPSFLWGTATAAHQVEGNCTNNDWARWEQGPPLASGKERPHSGSACEHWTRFREDIQRMKDLGLNSYRFSIEWSKIEPRPGVFDESAIAHYHEVLDALADAGIVPMITLFHFSLPLWFADLGGFEHESNIPYFVAFSERVFREFASKCQLWCTVNEPEVYVEGGYSSGNFPPGKKDVKLAGVVLRNVLEAHVQAYIALKALPGGASAEIGIVKDIFQFEPRSAYNPVDCVAAALVDGVMNESILRFLRTGHFKFSMPLQAKVVHTNPRAPSSYDFVGLNYYSHFHVRVRLSGGNDVPFEMVHLPREEALMTDMPFPIYAEGFYHALKRVATLGKPIYVTENGIADATGDKRELFIRRYLYALSAAMQDGVDVRGYYYWTLVDNFEWDKGYDMKFGLFSLDLTSQRRQLRPSAQAFGDIVRRFAPAPDPAPEGVERTTNTYMPDIDRAGDDGPDESSQDALAPEHEQVSQ